MRPLPQPASAATDILEKKGCEENGVLEGRSVSSPARKRKVLPEARKAILDIGKNDLSSEPVVKQEPAEQIEAPKKAARQLPQAPLRGQSAPRQATSPTSATEMTPRAPGVFIEFFSGGAGLTAAVRAAGLQTGAPQDLATGGLDVTAPGAMDIAKAMLTDLRATHGEIMVHLAPPCASFSRARDRSHKTRLRSPSFPEGLPGK